MDERLHPARQSVSAKLKVIPGLVLTSVVTGLLLGEASSNWASSDGFAEWISTNRASVAIIVQVIAQILGMIHLYSLREYSNTGGKALSLILNLHKGTTTELSFRRLLAHSQLSLDFIKFIQAFQFSAFNWSLPLPLAIPLLFWIFITFIPAALWAGAITPIVVASSSTATIKLPSFSNDSWLLVPQGSAPTINTEMGYFTYYPEYVLNGLLTNSASSATSRTGNASRHTKVDNTGYVYVGRSYGVGASVGLVDKNFVKSSVNYTFHETGLDANVSCIYNTSSAFNIGPDLLPSDWYVHMSQSGGSLPNNANLQLPIVAAFFEHEFLAIASSGNTTTTPYYVAFATMDDSSGPAEYGVLNQAQCSIVFNPRNYSITVDTSTTNRTIRVEPVDQSSAPTMPIHGDQWAAKSINTITFLANIFCTTLRTSVLGDMFQSNILNAKAAYGDTSTSDLLGIRDSLTSIIDNSLAAIAAAQLMILNDTSTTTVQVNYPSVRFGKPAYIDAISAVNIIICLCYLFELIRTRCWYHVPKFSLMDIGSVIIATSGGGTGIADEAYLLHKARGSMWEANSSDSVIGELQIRQEVGPSAANAIVLRLGRAKDYEDFQMDARSESNLLQEGVLVASASGV